MRVIIQGFPGRLHGEDSGEFTFVDTEYFRECTPGSPKEDGVELAVVLEELS